MGVEPTSTAWEAVVLPMNYDRKNYYLFILSILVGFVNRIRFKKLERNIDY